MGFTFWASLDNRASKYGCCQNIVTEQIKIFKVVLQVALSLCSQTGWHHGLHFLWDWALDFVKPCLVNKQQSNFANWWLMTILDDLNGCIVCWVATCAPIPTCVKFVTAYIRDIYHLGKCHSSINLASVELVLFKYLLLLKGKTLYPVCWTPILGTGFPYPYPYLPCLYLQYTSLS